MQKNDYINSSFWEAINTVSNSELFLSFSWWVGRQFPICSLYRGLPFWVLQFRAGFTVTCNTWQRSVALTSAHLTQTWITRAVMSRCLTFVWSLIDLFIFICCQRIFSLLWTQYLECFLISLKRKPRRWEQASFRVSFTLCLLPSAAPFRSLHCPAYLEHFGALPSLLFLLNLTLMSYDFKSQLSAISI